MSNTFPKTIGLEYRRQTRAIIVQLRSTTMKFGNALAIVVGSLIMHNSVLHAAVTIDVVESGGNVVATTSGTVNLTGLTFRSISSLGNNGMVYGSGLSIAHDGGILTGAAGPLGVYTLDTTVVFSTGNLIAATSGSGDAVGFDSRNENTTVPDNLYLPNGYVSGTPISSTSTWELTDIATLGLIPGTYVVSWSSDSLTLNIGGAPASTYTVGGTVSGLTGSVTLQNNSGDDIIKTTNDGFTFPAQAEGTDYAVTVSSQPTGQTCTVTGGGNNDGSGTNITANVTNVAVTCVTDVIPTYSVGGTVSGLTGTGLALQNNGGDTLAVAAAATDFAFATELLDLATYAVTVSTQPTGQTCSVTNGSGTIAAADVTDVGVNCVDVAPPAPATPIPTMSEWALIMLSTLLGLMVFANRKRLF